MNTVNHMKRSPSIVALSLVFVSLFGVGCAKRQGPTLSATTTESRVERRDFPTYVADKTNEKPEPRQQVLAAFAALGQAKSFRAKVQTPTDKGAVNGTLSFVRPDRFQGNVAMDQYGAVEIIAVGRSLYIKPPNDKWIDISKTSYAKKFTASLSESVAYDSIMLSSDSALIVDAPSHDSAHGCDLYRVTVSSKSNGDSTADVCVSGGYPKTMTVKSTSKTVTVEYFDIDKIFLIVKPM